MPPHTLPRLFMSDLVIDLGTDTTLLAVPGQSQIWCEPSVLALKNTPDGGYAPPLAVGLEALHMEGKVPSSIRVVRPLSNGVIVDLSAALTMLSMMLDKQRPVFGYRNILISTPFATTAIEAKTFLDLAWGLKPRRALLVAEPLAAAVGAQIPLLKNEGQMLVDIGKGIIEAVILSQGSIVASASSRLEGRSDNERLMQHLVDVYGLVIGPHMAEQTKRLLASGLRSEKLAISGWSSLSRLPSRIFVCAAELKEVLEPCALQIVTCIAEALERAPVELVTDIMEQGITLTGGGALHYGLASRLSDHLNIAVTIAPSPLEAVVLGNRRILESPELCPILAS